MSSISDHQLHHIKDFAKINNYYAEIAKLEELYQFIQKNILQMYTMMLILDLYSL